jgi:hypothetical protein
VVVDLAAGELERVLERVSGRFARAEPRARVRGYVSGLVAALERKNGWTLAEQAGETVPDGMQRLLAARTGTWRESATMCAAMWSIISATRAGY